MQTNSSHTLKKRWAQKRTYDCQVFAKYLVTLYAV